MKSNTKITLSVFLMVLAGFIFIQDSAQAFFSLSVSPRRGGQNIRFDASENEGFLRNEEVTVTINTTQGVQYNLFQTMYQPLTNEKGDSLPQGSFIVFSPSDSIAGNLRTQLETPVSMGRQQIYTSNSAGDADEFILVYNVRVPENQPSGVYHTNITFSLEPANAAAGVSPSVVTLDVRVELTSTFKVQIQGASGSARLEFSRVSKDSPVSTGILNFNIQGNLGDEYHVSQKMESSLTLSDGTELEDNDISFQVEGVKNAPKVSGGTLGSSTEVLYHSNEGGQGDAFQVQYSFKAAELPKAGTYTGVLTVQVESKSSLTAGFIYQIPIRLEVEPIFYIEAITPGALSNLSFGSYKTGQEEEQRLTQIIVYNNLGKPYQVSQIVSRKLTTVEGDTMKDSEFNYYLSDASSGKMLASVPTPVVEGESVIFNSDEKGTPEKFNVNYTLKIPNDSKAGAYSSTIQYSATSL